MGVFIELKASPVAVNAKGGTSGELRTGTATAMMANVMFEQGSNGESPV